MPAKKMCAACVCRGRDRAAIVFKQGAARPEFTQSEAVKLPGAYCATAAWQVLLQTMQTSAEYIGGEVRFAETHVEKDAEICS